jgi:hypothetical protein
MEFKYASKYELQRSGLARSTLKPFYKTSAASETFREPNQMFHPPIGTSPKQWAAPQACVTSWNSDQIL